MPPLETETALESYERGRFESRVSSQELSNLCSMIKRVMTDRLRQREPRMGAAAAAIAALVRQRQPAAAQAGAAAAAAVARQPVAPQPVVAQQNEPENVAQPQEEPESSGSDGSSDGNSSSGSSSSPEAESQPQGGPARSRRFNLRIIGIPEAEDKANEAQAILEQLIAENFPELQKNGASLQIEKAQRVPSRFDEKKATPRHVLVTFLHLSDKERVVRLARQRKEVTFQGVAVRLASDFSPQVLQARRQWSSVYRVLQEHECQPRILYPARLSFVYQGKRKTFLEMQALKKFVAQVPSLGNLLSDVLLPVEKESAKE